MNPPRLTHYGLRAGEGSASEVETGHAEFSLLYDRRGKTLYWRGHQVDEYLYNVLARLPHELRQSIYDAHMKALSLSEHDSGGAA